ncbi:hypothetical protein Tco_1047255 [Tanacetum coccineum]
MIMVLLLMSSSHSKIPKQVNGLLLFNSSRKNTSVEASRNKMANNENLSGSYVYAVKKGTLYNDKEKEMKTALVLDESCFLDCDLSLILMEKVKEFSSLSNLKIRAKEVNGWNRNFMEEEDDQTESDNVTTHSESDVDEIHETIFKSGKENFNEANSQNKEANESTSEDPFHIYDLLQKK